MGITGFWWTGLGVDGIPLKENGKNKHEGAESLQLGIAMSENAGQGSWRMPNGLDLITSLRMLCKRAEVLRSQQRFSKITLTQDGRGRKRGELAAPLEGSGSAGRLRRCSRSPGGPRLRLRRAEFKGK